MAETKNVVVMNEISKSFPGVEALVNVNFELRKGEIHGLVGENGAGKSTLIKVLTGVEQPDKGTIEIDGELVQVRSPEHSLELGISTVYQEVNLCTNISIAENIMLGHEPHNRFGSLDWRKMNELARKAVDRLGVDIDVTQPLGNYSVAIQQMVAITRALEILSAKVLILDEPTSSLDVQETNLLFDVMRKLKKEGLGIIFITHFLDQVYEISDRITVLRNGNYVGTFDTSSLPIVELVAKMLGRSLTELNELSKARSKTRKAEQHLVLEAKGLGRTGVLDPVDLELNAKEILGIAGLLGSGRTELAGLLFGLEAPNSGSLIVDGKQVSGFSPYDSLKRGIALCPEDRKLEGVVGELTIRENIVLALQARYGWFKFLTIQKQTEIAEEYIKLLGIATPSPDQLVKNLSGGNQQKVILARWLATNPKVLILDEPTRGIDVGAKAEIQKLVLQLAEEGKSCVFISSELEEVQRVSDRIAVLRDHQKVAEYASDVDDKTLIQSIAGEK